MNITQRLLKIKYVDEGYLPYYPYHLISEKELISAALEYISDNYRCPNSNFITEYNSLMKYRLYSIIDRYMDKDFREKYPGKEKPTSIPDWIYSYMLGAVINENSDTEDIYDLLVLLNLDNLYDEFDLKIYSSIYEVSGQYMGKYPEEYLSWDLYWYSQYHPEEFEEEIPIPETQITGTEDYNLRPPSIFGEHHVIRALRLEQVGI